MRKTLLAVTLIACLLVVSAQVSAGIYVFQPDPPDLYDLEHSHFFEWGLEFEGNWQFDDVVLTFQNIRNWSAETNMLFIHLLDDVTLGTTFGWDGEALIDDYYAGRGVLIDAWSDTDPTETAVNLSYSLKDLGFLDDFSAYVANDGMVGFGFDPDCHFWNDGVQLTVIGTSIPEPGTMMLFALGMVSGVAAYRRKKK